MANAHHFSSDKLHPLEAIMDEIGATQQEIADALGYSTTLHISQVINAQQYPLRPLVMLVQKLGYDPEQFLAQHESFSIERRKHVLNALSLMSQEDVRRIEEAARKLVEKRADVEHS